MAETANFTYEGNAILKVRGSSTAADTQDLEILSVQHLIPISVRLKVNGKETVFAAYVDYTDKSVMVPHTEVVATGVPEANLAEAVKQYLADRIERQMIEAEAQQNLMARENYRMAQAHQARASAAAQAAVESEEDE